MQHDHSSPSMLLLLGHSHMPLQQAQQAHTQGMHHIHRVDTAPLVPALQPAPQLDQRWQPQLEAQKMQMVGRPQLAELLALPAVRIQGWWLVQM